MKTSQYVLDEQQCQNFDVSSRREWMLENGIGGYAMGTVSGVNTRRYHGHLIAATTPPTGRMNLLANLEMYVSEDGNPIGISSNQYTGAIYPEGYGYLQSFTLAESALWKFKVTNIEIEKEILMHHDLNAVTILFRNVGKSSFHLNIRPLIQHRDHHGNFHEIANYPQSLEFSADVTRAVQDSVLLEIFHPCADRSLVQGWYYRFEHLRESERGLDPRDDLFCPCELDYDMMPGQEIAIVASTGGEVQPIASKFPIEANRIFAEQIHDSASKFVINSARRTSIVAGYPWFTDWGRDTMISVPGILLRTGRTEAARHLLSDYAGQMFQGLIPNRFVEQGEKPEYNTVDATLWFVNAIYKCLRLDWEPSFAKQMGVVLLEIFHWHQVGTLFGIKVDQSDGLLTQGVDGVQLTWMDAKVGDWVVTPRHGKPVEINGLWINALRCMEWLLKRLDPEDPHIAQIVAIAEKAESSFDPKFWNEARGHYLDTADPDDASLRPNQLIPMALPFVCLNPAHALAALNVVSRELVTPMGIRTLGPNEPGYKGRYRGPLPELDAAYHQGTAWPWLLGSYASALVRYGNDRREAKRVLKNTRTMLTEYGLGGIAEVYDGDEPQQAGGCPWQAWSSAEIYRAWLEDVEGDPLVAE
jgi:predicted glycogen debranching enzyme